MKSFAAISSLLLTTALAAPATKTKTYEISDFTERKINGQEISTVFFDLSNSAGHTVECSASPFTAGREYACGDHDEFRFSYYPAASETEPSTLDLSQVRQKYEGSARLPQRICRAGPVSAKDQICSVTQDVEIRLRK